MGLFDKKLDLKDSKLILEGTKKEQEDWNQKINERIELLQKDRRERESVQKKRHDFYIGDHNKYTNIIGKTTTQKKGHASAVFNYAGKTVTKIAYSLANNPPKLTVPARKVEDQFKTIERARSQGVEEFIDDVFEMNHFQKGAYRRCVFNQILGDGALKICPMKNGDDWEIKIVNHENMRKIMVGWRSDDPSQFDYVAVEDDMSSDAIYREYGIKVPKEWLEIRMNENKQSSDGHYKNGQWGSSTDNRPASGENSIPTVKVQEYDDIDVYAIRIAGQLVQLAFKDDVTYPKIPFYIIVPNIPNPDSPWSVSDIDYMLDPQVEFNETSNEERNYIRVGSNQKFLAINMSEFDPESVKTGSGQVIFVDSPDGTADFRPLNTNVNVFPVDQYLNRVQSVMYDLGIPKVTFGSGGSDSGRSKAMDYQSLVDLTIFKRDAWELALTLLAERIQILGNFYFEELDMFKDPETGEFVIRYPEFDWTDVLPITEGDKIVNVLNKVTMGLPFRLAFKELGYRDVEGVLNEMREEAKDEDLMMFRAKLYQVSPGLLQAQQRAQQQTQEMEQGAVAGGMSTPGAPEVNQATPTLTNNGSEGGVKPVSQRGGTTSFSSAKGFIDRTRQNMTAAGR